MGSGFCTESMPRRNYFDLIRAMVVSDFRLRYQGSLLGFFWALLRPLLMYTVLYVVFARFVRFPIANYQLYLLLGVIFWNFFSEATNSSIVHLFGKAGLMKKVNFPRIIIIFSSTLIAFLNFCLNILVFSLFFLFSRLSFHWVLFFEIFFVLEFLILSFGVSLFLASLSSKFKDLIHLWDIILQALFWLTPIVYSTSMIPDRYSWLIKINPIAQLIGYSRDLILYGQLPTLLQMALVTGLTLVILVIGYLVFSSRQHRFIEEL